jgi:YD repeat-containing protein
MKNALVVVILTLLLSYPAAAGPKTAKELDELSGPVKAMAVEKAQLTRQFGKFLGKFSATWKESPHVRTYGRNYDAKGNKTLETWYNPNGSVNRRVQFTYDPNGNLTEAVRYKADGTLADRVAYVYDAKGNKTEETTYKADGSLEKYSTFTYEFDSHGNWTKMTEITRFETDADTYWAESVYRTITYY